MTMKLLILLTIYTALTKADKRCHGIYFDKRYYDVHILKEGINNIHDLILNNNDNNLYFTFDQIAQIPTRAMGYLNLDTHVAGVIDGIRNATAIAIDTEHNRVYAGGSDGLFRINEFKVPERLPVVDDVQTMYYAPRNGLYYTNRRREAYKFEDGAASLIPELQGLEVDRLVVDNDRNILFLQKDKLFRIKLDTRAVNTHEKQVVNYITTDLSSRAFVCAKDGVYIYNKYKFALDKMADLRNLKALTFNRVNEAIYAVNDLLVKLSLNHIACFED